MPPSIAIDMTGLRFGKLVAVKRVEGRNPKRAYWLCRCDCGNEAVKMGKYLRCGDTQSCGCDQQAYRAGGNRKYNDLPLTHPREYTIWRSMKSRCYVKSSSNYRFYGARGVTICDRWRKSFVAFIADMGACPPELTLDRIDPSGHYEPTNCRWETWEVQHQNLRPIRRPYAPRARRP